MRIVVLAHALRAGGGRATAMNMLHALRKVDTGNQYLVFVPDQPEYRSLRLENQNWQIYYYKRRFSHVGRRYFDRFTLPRIVSRFKPDVIWGPGNLGFAKPPCPQALSIQNPYLFYDVRHTGRLTLIDRLWLFFLRRAFTKSVKAADLVFCQTETMRKRLISIHKYEGRTVVTSKVVSAFSASGAEDCPAVFDKFAGKFKAFYLTRYYPHKGLEFLVETVDRYREELSDMVSIITIDAGQHPNAARLLKRIVDLGLEDRVVDVGPLAQNKLAGYFKASDCLLMPTRLESFTGTYLEAMHFGLPIVTSDLDFAREVCGDAAVYFDPWSHADMKDAILRVKQDSELRRLLVSRGKERLSAQFGRTWEDIATDIQAGLESLVAEAKAG